MGGINPFSATGQPTSGGITGPQTAFAKYTGAENEIANAQAFSKPGMGMSTGLTQADAGAGFGTAIQEAGMSDADAAAEAQLQNAQQAAAKSNVSGITKAAGGLLGGL